MQCVQLVECPLSQKDPVRSCMHPLLWKLATTTMPTTMPRIIDPLVDPLPHEIFRAGGESGGDSLQACPESLYTPQLDYVSTEKKKLSVNAFSSWQRAPQTGTRKRERDALLKGFKHCSLDLIIDATVSMSFTYKRNS